MLEIETVKTRLQKLESEINVHKAGYGSKAVPMWVLESQRDILQDYLKSLEIRKYIERETGVENA